MSECESYGNYDYSVYEYWPDCHREKNLGFCYTIYKKNTDKVVRDSDEWFETYQEAKFAAIGHITLLENGGG